MVIRNLTTKVSGSRLLPRTHILGMGSPVEDVNTWQGRAAVSIDSRVLPQAMGGLQWTWGVVPLAEEEVFVLLFTMATVPSTPALVGRAESPVLVFWPPSSICSIRASAALSGC